MRPTWVRAQIARAGVALGLVVAAATWARTAESQAEHAEARARRPKLDEALKKLGDEVASWGGTFGAIAMEVEHGQILAGVNEHKALNPASNAKLVTEAAALRTLGAQHRYTTGIYGKVKDGQAGELVLRSDGDPSLSTEDLLGLARQLKELGVRKVAAIAVDQSAFDDKYVPPAFEQQPNEWAAFRAPVAPVSLNENTIELTVRARSAGEKAAFSFDPPGFVDVQGTIATTKTGEAERVALTLSPNGGRLSARVSGSIPEGPRVVHLVKRVDDPRLLGGYALRSALTELGVEVASDVHTGGEKVKALLVAHRSRPLSELLSALGKESNNFYAEMVFKTLASKKAAPATAEAAADAATAELRAMGAFEAGDVVKNGSGLFDANRMTPWSFATLLRSAQRDSAVGPELVASLAVGGVDGTLHGRFKKWAARRAVRAKTGTLESVAALSGYVLAPPGTSPVVFSVMVNGIPGKVGAARPLMDRVVEAIAAELWR